MEKNSFFDNAFASFEERKTTLGVLNRLGKAVVSQPLKQAAPKKEDINYLNYDCVPQESLSTPDSNSFFRQGMEEDKEDVLATESSTSSSSPVYH